MTTKKVITLISSKPYHDLRGPVWYLSKGAEKIERIWDEKHDRADFKIHTEEAIFHFIPHSSNDLRDNWDEYVKRKDEVWALDPNHPNEGVPWKTWYTMPCDLDMRQNNTDFQQWCNDGHILMFGTNIPNFTHRNFFQDYMFSMYTFYHRKGLAFNNVYNDITSPKTHLLGLYHRGKHNVFDETLLERDEIAQGCQAIMGSDMIFYEYDSNYNYIDIMNDYQFCGDWDRTDVSSYTDYIRSVANVVWESRGQVNNKTLYYYPTANPPMPQERDHITEKTLKAILHSKANIFFIMAQCRSQTEWLMENGFWFLNYDFYKTEPRFITYEDMIQCVFDTVQYIKDLKQQYKTNEDVHKFLVDKHGDKLQYNHSRMIELLHQGANDRDVARLKNILLKR